MALELERYTKTFTGPNCISPPVLTLSGRATIGRSTVTCEMLVCQQEVPVLCFPFDVYLKRPSCSDAYNRFLD
jgi:hypothetical protein